MKDIFERRLLIFIITVFAIMAKPCFVFASQSVRYVIHHYGNNFDTRRVVRKRNEFHNFEAQDAIDDIRKSSAKIRMNSGLSFLKRIQFALLFFRSSFISLSTLISSRHSTVFQISPHSDQYLQISIIRIWFKKSSFPTQIKFLLSNPA